MKHYTCAQLLDEAATLLVRIQENDPEWRIDVGLWLDRCKDWQAEHSLGASDE